MSTLKEVYVINNSSCWRDCSLQRTAAPAQGTSGFDQPMGLPVSDCLLTGSREQQGLECRWLNLSAIYDSEYRCLMRGGVVYTAVDPLRSIRLPTRPCPFAVCGCSAHITLDAQADHQTTEGELQTLLALPMMLTGWPDQPLMRTMC